MIIRYLSSAGIGILITTALLWTMNSLIDMAEPVETASRGHHFLPWVRLKTDTPVAVIEKAPQKVKEPASVPSHTPPSNAGETTPIGISGSPTAPTGPLYQSGLPGNVDSGLISIINAQPDYPTAAIQKGIEGYVIVQFDVTAMGTVENVEVVETSNAVLNKAAVKATYQSRYKPKTVDGVSYGSIGLRKLFRFEMNAS